MSLDDGLNKKETSEEKLNLAPLGRLDGSEGLSSSAIPIERFRVDLSQSCSDDYEEKGPLVSPQGAAMLAPIDFGTKSCGMEEKSPREQAEEQQHQDIMAGIQAVVNNNSLNNIQSFKDRDFISLVNMFKTSMNKISATAVALYFKTTSNNFQGYLEAFKDLQKTNFELSKLSAPDMARHTMLVNYSMQQFKPLLKERKEIRGY